MGCGSQADFHFDPTVSTQAPPFIARVAPTTGRAGDTITVFGFGFSTIATANTVSFAGTAVNAATHALVDPAVGAEIEKITVTLPSSATTGATTIFVTVFEQTSNNDTVFTVTP